MGSSSILFVDDEEHVLNALRRMLHHMRSEWEMTFADGGEAALNVINTKQIDVLVTDMRMPGMDGVQLLEHVQRQHPHIVRLVLSGHCDKELIFRSVGAAHQFMAKPCDEELLIQTIERSLGLRNHLGNSHLESIASQISALPALPEVYDELMRILQMEDPPIDGIAALIERDIGVSAKTVQIANSAFFGLKRHIESPANAVLYLGIDTIKAIVLGTAVFSAFDTTEVTRFSVEALEKHSFRVGSIACWVAHEIGLSKEDQDNAFTAGILHDAGKLIFVTNFPEKYAEALAIQHDTGSSASDSEVAILGASHGELGGYLLGLWGLPDAIVESVVFHSNPALAPHPCRCPLMTIHIADWIDHMLNTVIGEPSSCGPDRKYLEEIGLGGQWEELLEGAEIMLAGNEIPPVGENDEFN